MISASRAFSFSCTDPEPASVIGASLSALAVAQVERRLALVLQGVMGQHDLRQVDALALAAELQQRHQPLEEEEPLLDGRVAVVEHLRQEAVHAARTRPCRS